MVDPSGDHAFRGRTQDDLPLVHRQRPYPDARRAGMDSTTYSRQ
jgi:hypothetical protein